MRRFAGRLQRHGCLFQGSAPLPAIEHRRVEALTGQKLVERYGMTETLINASIRADGDRVQVTSELRWQVSSFAWSTTMACR